MHQPHRATRALRGWDWELGTTKFACGNYNDELICTLMVVNEAALNVRFQPPKRIGYEVPNWWAVGRARPFE